MSYHFGIDFGTTNSAVIAISEINGQKIDSFRIGNDTTRPLPSYVAIDKNTGEVKTGLEAKNSITSSDEYEIFSSIKSIIDEDREWIIAGKKWTQIDIAAELFKALKKNAESAVSTEMDSAVVAVPVGFSSKKKNNVRKAAKKAGISVKMFISEPTAAYCSRLDKLRKYKNIAVFDWGGGTLDVVILRVENGVINEVYSDGIKMAGNDIDKILAEKVCLKVARKKDIEFSFEDLSPEYQLRLLALCEQAKCNLADEDIASISMAHLDTFGRANEKIEYDYFSLLIENHVDRAVKCLLDAIKKAGMNRESIDCILCEGGSSRLRPLQERLLKEFSRDKLEFPRTAMWDIGSGAAEVSYRPGCYTLNRPVGVMLANDEFYPLFDVKQRIPTDEKTVTFGITDSSKIARLIFTDLDKEGNTQYTVPFPVNVSGRADEQLVLKCRIEADMVFKAKIQSNLVKSDYFRVWTTSDISVSYDLDAPEPEVNSRYIKEK